MFEVGGDEEADEGDEDEGDGDRERISWSEEGAERYWIGRGSELVKKALDDLGGMGIEGVCFVILNIQKKKSKSNIET
jgi:hypothetical protein